MGHVYLEPWSLYSGGIVTGNGWGSVAILLFNKILLNTDVLLSWLWIPCTMLAMLLCNRRLLNTNVLFPNHSLANDFVGAFELEYIDRIWLDG